MPRAVTSVHLKRTSLDAGEVRGRQVIGSPERGYRKASGGTAAALDARPVTYQLPVQVRAFLDQSKFVIMSGRRGYLAPSQMWAA